MRKLIYLLIAVFFAGCSGTPGENEIEDQLVASLEKNGLDKIYEVENLEKVNGYEKDERTYIAIVKYDVEFKIGFEELADKFDNGENSGREYVQNYRTSVNLYTSFGEFQKGDQFEVKKELKFIDTDNGWRLEGEL